MVTLADEKDSNFLQAFDRLFDKAMTKLNLECSDEDRKEARDNFVLRFREAMELIHNAGGGRVSAENLHEMETAVDDLTPAHIAGYIAVGPLAIHLQNVMRSIAAQAAQQRLLDQLIEQADDRYGGN